MSCCCKEDLETKEDKLKLCDYYQNRQEESTLGGIIVGVCLIIATILFFVLLIAPMVHAEELTASWYSEASLKKEGTWKTSKGVMANGQKFDETKLTCATRLYPLGSIVTVKNLKSGASVCVKVTDRIGKRFAKTRIDLSKAAFQKIASLNQGLVRVEVTR